MVAEKISKMQPKLFNAKFTKLIAPLYFPAQCAIRFEPRPRVRAQDLCLFHVAPKFSTQVIIRFDTLTTILNFPSRSTAAAICCFDSVVVSLRFEACVVSPVLWIVCSLVFLCNFVVSELEIFVVPHYLFRSHQSDLLFLQSVLLRARLWHQTMSKSNGEKKTKDAAKYAEETLRLVMKGTAGKLREHIETMKKAGVRLFCLFSRN